MQRHRSSAICVEDGTLLVVELVDPISGQVYILPPGGQVESGESPVQAAVRETYEETGFEVIPLLFEDVVAKYDFYWAGKNYQCSTHLIPVRLKNSHQRFEVVHPGQTTSYITKVFWLPVEDGMQYMRFIPQLFDAVHALLLKLQRN